MDKRILEDLYDMLPIDWPATIWWYCKLILFITSIACMIKYLLS